MILYLTSSPCVIGADRAILNPSNEFVMNLRRDIPTSANCLYIPSDPGEHAFNSQCCQDMYSAFSEVGICFREMKILCWDNAHTVEELVIWSDVVILSGGHVPTQNLFINDIGLGDHLRLFDGVVIGISAGSMNCAATVYAQPEREGETLDPAYQRFLPGLALTDWSILPHYQQVKDYFLDGKRLYEEVTFPDSISRCFLVLPDGSYVRQTDLQTVMYGLGFQLHDEVMEQISRQEETKIL